MALQQQRMRGSMLLAVALLLAMCSRMRPAQAYPMYFHGRGYANSCTDSPTGRVGGHGTPVADSAITVEVALSGQAVASTVCPGQVYELSVAFGDSTSRAALLSVSQGKLAESNVAGCPGAMTTSGKQRVQGVKANWVVPCDASGRANVKVTSGVAPIGSLRSAGASLDITPACAASSCPRAASTAAKAASASAAKAAPANGTVTATDGPSTDTYTPTNTSLMTPTGSTDDSPTASTVALVGSAPLNCPPSSLGYQCSQQVADGVTVHYSGPGSTQPGNSCTQGAGLNPAVGNASGPLVHYAIESRLPGYAAIGFPLQPGVMVPSDAVIGSVDQASGAVQVETYRLTSEVSTGANVVQPVWATGLGAVRTSTPLQATIVCFSRPLAASGTLRAALDPSGVPIIWAAHTSTGFQQQHALMGSLNLNMQSGQPSALAGDDSYLPIRVRYAAQIAHGFLMAAAFFAFMPAGVLAARHKWLFAHKETGKLSPLWFILHQSLQHAAITCILASFVVAMALFYRKNGTGSLLHALYTPHLGIGAAVAAAALLQGALGAARPTPLTHRWRGAWRALHCVLGLSTLGLGIANCFIGVVLAHDLRRMSWAAWLAPMCVLLGLILVGGLGLELAKIREQAQGRYEPATHTYYPRKRDGEADDGSRQDAASMRDTPSPVSDGEL